MGTPENEDIEIKDAAATEGEAPESGKGSEETEATLSPTQELEKKLAATAEIAAKAQNDLLYLRAEFDNYKKQSIKERSDYLKYGSERLITELLEVIDNFDRALATPATAENIDTFSQGMQLTSNELKGTLKKFGVEEVPCKGEAFDPTYHEALSSEETDEVEPGHITQVFKGAYKLHDRLIRPAQVVVAKAKS